MSDDLATHRAAPRAGRSARAVYGAIIFGAVLIVAGLLVQQLASLLLAIMITIVLSLPMSWCAERLERFGIPRPAGALIGLLIGLAGVAAILTLLLPPMIQQAKMLINTTPSLVHAVEVKLSTVTGDRPGGVARQLQKAVPYLGALASGIPPVAFALTISPGTAIEVLIIYIVVHQVEANIIGPLVMSRAVPLHPAVIAFGVVAVGEVFGFLGLIVAVPILSLTTILIDELWVRGRESA